MTAEEFEKLVDELTAVIERIKDRDRQLERYEDQLQQEVTSRTQEIRKATTGLASANAEMELFWQSIPSILVGVNREGSVTRCNAAAARAFGITDSSPIGQHWAECGIKWLRPDMRAEVDKWVHSSKPHFQYDDATFEKDGHTRVLGLNVRRMTLTAEGKCGFIITGADITERRLLEDQLRQAHKLEAIGQLAAGIAHEINTPAQFVSDNTTFLKESWEPIAEFMRSYHEEYLKSDPTNSKFSELWQKGDFDYLLSEVPKAFSQSLDGLNRIAKIVKAMKEFSHPGSEEKVPVDINHAIETTVAVTRNEWKYVADVVLQLDSALPLVPCILGEFNQAIVNLIVNAAHAIGAGVQEGSGSKGTITIRTRRHGDSAEISIRDSGHGVPEAIRSRIFEPFFTTKPVGKGTGQGLSQVHSTVVKRHQGQLWVESEEGQSATFFIRLPLEGFAG